MFIDQAGAVHEDGAMFFNGQGFGLGQQLSEVRDQGLRRPYFNERGVRCVTIKTGRMVRNKSGLYVPEQKSVPIANLMAHGISSPVMNATSLRKDEWIHMDQVILRAARLRLKAWTDLAGANTYGGFNGMGKVTVEYEAMSDPGEAVVDMDGLTDGRTDAPLFSLRSIPLPITHSDFWLSARRLDVSRNSSTPLDTTMAEACGRRVAEMVEKTVIGVETGAVYGPTSSSDARYTGTSAVYGMTNFPQRLTKTNMTNPTAPGWTPATTISEVISMRESLYANRYFGPFRIYTTPAWDTYLDQDYILSGGNVATQTLRERLESIDGITGIRRLDFWTGAAYQMVMVQMTQDVARAIVGMDITTVQWESQGGLRLNFKVMAIMVPQYRYDYYGRTGILHGTTST